MRSIFELLYNATNKIFQQRYLQAMMLRNARKSEIARYQSVATRMFRSIPFHPFSKVIEHSRPFQLFPEASDDRTVCGRWRSASTNCAPRAMDPPRGTLPCSQGHAWCPWSYLWALCTEGTLGTSSCWHIRTGKIKNITNMKIKQANR